MLKTKKYTFSVLLIIILANSYSQSFNFKNYNTKSGLIGSNVNGIYQDLKGYMWFAVQGGLSRFDGSKFKNYTKENGLIGNDVTSIVGDKRGNIWIGTTEGISKYDGVSFKNYSTKNGLADNFIRNVFIDNNDQLLVATDNGGVSKLNKETFENFTIATGLLTNTVFAITQDKKGNYWFATNSGICKYNGNEIINFLNQKNISGKEFYSLLIDSEGNIFFAGEIGDGFIKYSNGKFEKTPFPEQFPKKSRIFSMMEDKQGSIWFTTDNDGIIKYDKKDFYSYSEKNGLSSNQVYAIKDDYEGNIWIGTTNGGADKLNNESFAALTEKDGLSANKIASVYKNKDALFVGTQGTGLNIFTKGIYSFKQEIKELKNEKIFSIAENKKNEIWIGTEKSGIYVLGKKENNYSIKKHIPILLNKSLGLVDKIIFDKNGNTWISTYGNGAFLITISGEIRNYSTETGFPSDNLLTIYEDKRGNIWFGSIDVGAIKYDGKKFIIINEKLGLSNNAVWSITEDEKDNIFLGTGEGGINCINGKNITKIDRSDGLCSNFIETLNWDNFEKVIWVGTNNGINKVKLGSNLKPLSIQYYSEEEGFKGTEVTSCSQDKDGLIWFATINGVYRYDRKFDLPNKSAPKLVLTEILLDYKNVDWKKYCDSIDIRTNIPKSLVLPYNKKHLTFNFRALTTDNVKYTFILLGQDSEWSPLSSLSEANFSNIIPGRSYQFKVRAVNSNGIWSDEIVSFEFKINSPWWQTGWFISISILFGISSIYIFLKLRINKLAKEKKVLELNVAERTFELSLALKEIHDSINYAKIIQHSILPLSDEIHLDLPQSFVYYEPKNVVSGDFYWFHKKNKKLYFAVADCTGHGVPGAFMSMIGSSLLNEIFNENNNPDASEILNLLHSRVRKVLKQDRFDGKSQDGMDISLVIIDKEEMKLNYAGAKRPLYLFRKEDYGYQFIEAKADKQSIGGHQNENDFKFANHFFSLHKGDSLYMFTDGYVDQFGGGNEKKFSTKRLKETLESMQQLEMDKQSSELSSVISDWKGTNEQVDDILIIGIKI
jgi:ligand-binding sensor domain-containing protein/serine phosphatase RsbU (regulator of sigma subunit)